MLQIEYTESLLANDKHIGQLESPIHPAAKSFCAAQLRLFKAAMAICPYASNCNRQLAPTHATATNRRSNHNHSSTPHNQAMRDMP
jgi:hypothetical protein